MTGEPDPHWPRDAVRAVWHEWTNYARTMLSLLRAPGRFARGWATGEIAAINPVAAMLNTLAILVPWSLLWTSVLHAPDPSSPVLDLLVPLIHLLLWAIIGGLTHAPLRLLGARRPLRVTVGLAVLVGAGPLSIAHFALDPLVLRHLQPRVSGIVLVVSAVQMLVFSGYLGVALCAAHGLRVWRVVVGIVTGWALFVGLAMLMELAKKLVARAI